MKEFCFQTFPSKQLDKLKQIGLIFDWESSPLNQFKLTFIDPFNYKKLLPFFIRPPLEFLPVLGLLEWSPFNRDVTSTLDATLDAALLCSSRAGSDLGCVFGLV